MRVAWRRGLGLGALALAVGLGVLASRGAPSPGGDYGGATGVATGVLFLRAETLRREGRIDEVAAIYRRILELDPASEAAADRLAEALGGELRLLSPTPEGRTAWWREAMALVDAGLRAHPKSATLHWRRAALLLQVGGADPAVEAWLAAQGRDREREGIDSLREAVRCADSVPGVGRIHLEAIARRAPAIAAARLARGQDPEPFLAAGSEALALRGAVLDELTLDADPPVSAAVRLRAGLRLVAHVGADLAATPPRTHDARALADAYARTLGEDAVVSALRPLLR